MTLSKVPAYVFNNIICIVDLSDVKLRNKSFWKRGIFLCVKKFNVVHIVHKGARLL